VLPRPQTGFKGVLLLRERGKEGIWKRKDEGGKEGRGGRG